MKRILFALGFVIVLTCFIVLIADTMFKKAPEKPTNFTPSFEKPLLEYNGEYNILKINTDVYQYRYNKGGWAVFERKETQ